MDTDTKQSLDRLTGKVDQLVLRWSPWRHFINGIFSGIGVTLGATIVIALLVSLLHQLAGIDLFKPAIDQILPYVERSTNRIDDFPSPTYVMTPAPTPEISSTPSVGLEQN